jgi:hypothetical protein
MKKSQRDLLTLSITMVFLSVAVVSGLILHSKASTKLEGPESLIFAEGIVSTGHEFTLTFMPGMKEAYFTRYFPDKKINHVMRTELKSGKWQEPLPLAFSSDKWADLDPALSPNGKRLFFVSTRPSPHSVDAKIRNMDIWYADRVGNDWGTPQYLDILNSPGKEGSPTVAKDGTLCFFSDRGREANSNSIYCSELSHGKYEEPKKLGTEVNSETSDTSPFLSADGNTLLFYSTRPGGYGHADLYVSFRRKRKWSQAQNLGPLVNTAESEYNPSVSPDGRTLYFGRNGKIYWIAIELLKISGLDTRHLHD